MTPIDKIKRILDEGRVFLIGVTGGYELYIVKGDSGRVYDLKYCIETANFSCNCKNIRLTPCYHIKAVIALKE